MNPKLPSEEVQRALLELVEHFYDEDRAVHERQIRRARRLKLYWDNIFQAWYSEVAHDWRIWDNSISEDTADQAYYDKPINTFRAYIETIIAALSVTTPAAKCFPEDAASSLDTITAKAGDKIGQLIARHNNADLLWLKALYTYYTEGTVFCYTYSDTNEKYGTYEINKEAEELVDKDMLKCPVCGMLTEIDETTDIFQPEGQPEVDCTNCGTPVQMEQTTQSFTVTKIVGKTKAPKSRVCMEVYGGLYVKIANYAKRPCQSPYLIFGMEHHFSTMMEKYEHLLGNKNLIAGLKSGANLGPLDTYSQWGRLNTLYMGEYPNYIVTERQCWFRPSAFNILSDEKLIKQLKKLYPRGVKVCLVNDEFGSAESQLLDDYWTISENPLEDYLTHDPAGVGLVVPQEITNDTISLVLQTLEHGVGQTFADPGVLNFDSYRQTETIPGGVYEATPKSGKSLGDGFFQIKTATLSGEVLPFFEVVQGLAQLVSGALPSLFGGQLDGSNTASEYSMSQAQARQRIQNIWKLFTSWWKEVNGKAIPLYINEMKTDEKDVQRLPDGSFMNVFILMSELEGKIGKIELEASENVPLTWMQKKDVVMKMFELQNPKFLEMLNAPENIPILRDAIGLTDFYIPGEDDRSKQNDEIRQLLMSEPIQDPGQVTTQMPQEPNAAPEEGMEGEAPEAPEQEAAEGEEPQMPFMPSVEIDPTYDNHAIHFEIVRQWAVSEAGRTAKIENEQGYQNVLLHGQMHFFEMNKQMVLQNASAGAAKGKDNPEKPKGSKEITGEEDVNVAQ